jgi:hypothetical protein
MEPFTRFRLDLRLERSLVTVELSRKTAFEARDAICHANMYRGIERLLCGLSDPFERLQLQKMLQSSS